MRAPRYFGQDDLSCCPRTGFFAVGSLLCLFFFVFFGVCCEKEFGAGEKLGLLKRVKTEKWICPAQHSADVLCAVVCSTVLDAGLKMPSPAVILCRKKNQVRIARESCLRGASRVVKQKGRLEEERPFYHCRGRLVIKAVHYHSRRFSKDCFCQFLACMGVAPPKKVPLWPHIPLTGAFPSDSLSWKVNGRQSRFVRGWAGDLCSRHAEET